MNFGAAFLHSYSCMHCVTSCIRETPEVTIDPFHRNPEVPNVQGIFRSGMLIEETLGSSRDRHLCALASRADERRKPYLRAAMCDVHLSNTNSRAAVCDVYQSTTGQPACVLQFVTCASLQDPMFEGRWESLGRRMAIDETPLLAINRQLKASVKHPTYVVMLFQIEMLWRYSCPLAIYNLR